MKYLEDWTKILTIAIKSSENFVKYNGEIFEFRVFEFLTHKKGYIVIWNRRTRHAFNVSIKIDESVKSKIIRLEDSDLNDNDSEIPSDLIFSNNSKP